MISMTLGSHDEGGWKNGSKDKSSIDTVALSKSSDGIAVIVHEITRLRLREKSVYVSQICRHVEMPEKCEWVYPQLFFVMVVTRGMTSDRS